MILQYETFSNIINIFSQSKDISTAGKTNEHYPINMTYNTICISIFSLCENMLIPDEKSKIY